MAATSSLLAISRLLVAAAWSRLVVRSMAKLPGTGPTLGPGPGDCEHDPDSDWEPERELQELERCLKQQKKQILFQKIGREMMASGAPQRILSRNAMVQIRYLHKEFSKDWSVSRLAEGFGVSTDVIRRVLKSKFVPTWKQEIKQDQKILSKTRIIHHPQQKLTSREQPILPAFTGYLVSGSRLKSGCEALPPCVHRKGQYYNSTLPEMERNSKAWKIKRSQKVRGKVSQRLGREKWAGY
ncbi:neugrin [Gracilinanus agilis]|uniref:neugrin n=1 Tax=Gracilinanus agilis TaxID=191870 RepID=UPI001CFCA52C|nr:neugrin [Gracilinanus agilis]